jgi:hypothetical protein
VDIADDVDAEELDKAGFEFGWVFASFVLLEILEFELNASRLTKR